MLTSNETWEVPESSCKFECGNQLENEMVHKKVERATEVSQNSLLFLVMIAGRIVPWILSYR